VDELCTDCRNLLDLGKKTKQLNAEDSEIWVSVNIYPFYISGGENLYNEIRNTAKALDNQTKRAITKDSKYLGNHSSSGSASVVITKGQFEALERIYKEAITTLKNVYQSGLEKGQNMLMQLADGSMTLDKFDENRQRR
jgi:adenine-specific DNA methylase